MKRAVLVTAGAVIGFLIAQELLARGVMRAWSESPS
jgi:hypothetical protein